MPVPFCGIVDCGGISGHYLRTLTKTDAKKIVALHKRRHDINVCLDCLHVTKVHWLECPFGWEGAIWGEEGYQTVGLERKLQTKMALRNWFYMHTTGHLLISR